MNASNYSGDTFALTTTEQQVASLDTARSVLILFNEGDPATTPPAQIYFMEGADYFIEIPAGNGIKFDVPPMNEVWAKTGSGTTTLHVVQG